MPYGTAIPLLIFTSDRNISMWSPKDILKKFLRSIICKNPKLETTQMLINSRINKLWYCHSIEYCRLNVSANYSPWAKSDPLPVFANTSYQNTVNFILLYIANSLFHAITELSQCSKDHLVFKANKKKYVAFTEKVCQSLLQVSEHKWTTAMFVNVYKYYK